MQTVQEITAFISANDAIAAMPSSNDKKQALLRKGERHIESLLKQLNDNESVIFAMLTKGVFNNEDSEGLSIRGLGALIITDKRRLLYGHVGSWYRQSVQEVFSLTDVCHASSSVVTAFSFIFSLRHGLVKIKTREKICAIKVRTQQIKHFLAMVTDALTHLSLHSSKKSAWIPQEELKKLKELFDMKVISKEEFEAKKRHLLGL